MSQKLLHHISGLIQSIKPKHRYRNRCISVYENSKVGGYFLRTSSAAPLSIKGTGDPLLVVLPFVGTEWGTSECRRLPVSSSCPWYASAPLGKLLPCSAGG